MKFQIFCRYGTKQTNCILIAYNFVIHPQISIFSVFKIASLSSLWTKRCSQSLHLTIGRTTFLAHHVTQGSTALLLSVYCAVARRSDGSASLSGRVKALLFSTLFRWARRKGRWSLLPGRATETADAASRAPYCWWHVRVPAGMWPGSSVAPPGVIKVDAKYHWSISGHHMQHEWTVRGSIHTQTLLP